MTDFTIDWAVILNVLVTVVTVTCFIIKMNESIKTNERVLDIKLKYMEDALRTTDKSINNAVTMVENNLQHKIDEVRKDLGALHQELNMRINNVEVNLKEDVARLEAKQEKSNCIKERLATVEVKLEGLEKCYDRTQEDIEDLEEQLDDKE